MTACCRLTQPENSRKKKTSGAGNGSIQKAKRARGAVPGQGFDVVAAIGPSLMRCELSSDCFNRAFWLRRSFRTGRAVSLLAIEPTGDGEEHQVKDRDVDHELISQAEGNVRETNGSEA